MAAEVRPGSPGSDADSLGRHGVNYAADYAPLLSRSSKMRVVKSIVEKVALTDATVLICGESGVGKDVVARAIYAASARRDYPLVKVNCAALPADLLESELFGHEKGSFTGAYRRKLGKFEFANPGTIFLDEIGELPPSLQAKLLHVLQDLEFSRIGGRDMIRVDTRVIASTNRDLGVALRSREFREDLYYRLNVVEIQVPPLRERREEIPALAEMFLSRFNREYGRQVALTPQSVELFTSYTWPGNVRELENLVRRLVVLGDAAPIHEELLTRLRGTGLGASQDSRRNGHDPFASDAVETGLGLREIARRAALDAERKALTEVLARVHWNRLEASRILKVSYKTLLSKIDECGLAPDRSRRKPRSP